MLSWLRRARSDAPYQLHTANLTLRLRYNLYGNVLGRALLQFCSIRLVLAPACERPNVPSFFQDGSQ